MKTDGRWARAALVLLALAAVGGCASSTAYFTPDPELTTTTTPGGHHAAYYTVKIKSNIDGTVSIYSRGAYRVRSEKGAPGLLDVHMNIENDGTSAMMLDLSRTDIALYHGGRAGEVIRTLYQRTGPDTVGPGSTAHIKLVYSLPANMAPGSIDAFDLNWAVSNDAGSFAQSTPFVQRYYSDYTYSYYPYSYYGPYWGWGYWPYWYGGFYYSPNFENEHFEGEHHEVQERQGTQSRGYRHGR